MYPSEQPNRFASIHADEATISNASISVLTMPTAVINNLSTHVGLLPGVDSAIPTQLAIKTYVDNGVTADLATHEANSTTAHFSQDLTATGTPTFAAVTVNGLVQGEKMYMSTGQYTGQIIPGNALAQWHQLYSQLQAPNPSFGASGSFDNYTSQAVDEQITEHVSWRLESSSIAPTISISRITETVGAIPNRYVFYYSAIVHTIKFYLLCKSRGDIHHVAISGATIIEYNTRGTGATPDNLEADDVIIFDSDDPVTYPLISKMEAGYYEGRYNDPAIGVLSRTGVVGVLSPSYSLSIHDSFYQNKHTGIVVVCSTAGTTIPLIGAPSNGLVVPYNAIVYQSMTTGDSDIDYSLVGNYFTFKHAGRYGFTASSNTYAATPAAATIDTWGETSTDGITFTVYPGSLRRTTNSEPYKSRTQYGELNVTPAQAIAKNLMLRFMVLISTGATVINIQDQSQLLPNGQTTTGFGAMMFIKRIGSVTSDYGWY